MKSVSIFCVKRLGAGLVSACLFMSACSPGAAPVAAPAPTQAAPAPTQAQPAAAPTQVQAQPQATAAPTQAQAQAQAGGGGLIEASLANLSKTLHPYPDAASYAQPWVDASILMWGGGDSPGGGLLYFDWDALEYRPAMARDMPQVSADGKTFTFTLRDGLKWSDGSPVTVDDYVFAYDQASKEENHFVGLDTLQDIESFTSPDKNTLVVTLKETKARDLALGIVSAVGPVPKKVWDGKSWTDASTNPEILNPSVVLGPFKQQEYKIAERATFVPVDTYQTGKPKIPQVQILASQQPTVAYESLKAGRANWVANVPPSQYADAKANPALDVKQWTPANAVYRTLEFNMARPFLSDKRVREALAYSVSRSDLLDVAELGLGVPQYSFLTPSNQHWANGNVDKYDVDLNKAKQLLQDAGYQMQNGALVDKDAQPVKLQVLYPTSSGPRAKIAAYLQQQYKQLGIDIDVKGLDFNAYTDQVSNRHDFDISLATYGGGSLDPDLGPKAQLISNGQQNVTGYNNPQVDDLFKQGANELDEAKRKQIYDQIQTLVNADLPSHYLYALDAIDAFSKSVQGVQAHKGDRLDYNDALLQWSVTQ